MSEPKRAITVTPRQVVVAQDQIKRDQILGRESDPAVVLIANAKSAASIDAEALRRVLALADEFDAQVPWPHSWIGDRIREAAGIAE